MKFVVAIAAFAAGLLTASAILSGGERPLRRPPPAPARSSEGGVVSGADGVTEMMSVDEIKAQETDNTRTSPAAIARRSVASIAPTLMDLCSTRDDMADFHCLSFVESLGPTHPTEAVAILSGLCDEGSFKACVRGKQISPSRSFDEKILSISKGGCDDAEIWCNAVADSIRKLQGEKSYREFLETQCTETGRLCDTSLMEATDSSSEERMEKVVHLCGNDYARQIYSQLCRNMNRGVDAETLANTVIDDRGTDICGFPITLANLGHPDICNRDMMNLAKVCEANPFREECVGW